MEKARVLNLKLGIGIGMFQGLANVALNGKSNKQLTPSGPNTVYEFCVQSLPVRPGQTQTKLYRNTKFLNLKLSSYI